MMELARRSFIYGKINSADPTPDSEDKNRPYYDEKGKYGGEIKGGLANGYTEKELTDFWNKLKGYASYLFNKSHAASYSVLTLCTMYLKKYHPVEFFAALLSMQSKAEKIDRYVNVARKYDIKTIAPDINKSSVDFTPITEEKTIIYGLKAIKGIGLNKAYDLIASQPYANIEDCFEKLPKKIFNKRVALALAKCGAFDDFNKNRFEVINNIYDIRKDKEADNPRYNIGDFNKTEIINMESDILGCAITHTPWWNTVLENTIVQNEFQLIKVQEKIDKNGNTMAFVTLSHENTEIKSIAFAKTYMKNRIMFDKDLNTHLRIEGKRDDKGTLIISKVNTALTA